MAPPSFTCSYSSATFLLRLDRAEQRHFQLFIILAAHAQAGDLGNDQIHGQHGAGPLFQVAGKALSLFIAEGHMDMGVDRSVVIVADDAGEALVRWAVRIMDDFAAAEREMSEFSRSAGMSLHLGISNMVGSWLYSEVYSPFMRQHPQSTIILEEYPWADICQSVIAKELDMAYTTWEKGFSDPSLDLHHYLDSELYLVLPPKHELAGRRRIPFSCLDGRTLSVFAKNSLISNIITKKCEESGIHPQMINVTNQFSSMLNLVDTGAALGFVVMDQKSAPFNRRKYILRPLDEPVLLETGFITRRGAAPTRGMRLFMQYVQERLH